MDNMDNMDNNDMENVLNMDWLNDLERLDVSKMHQTEFMTNIRIGCIYIKHNQTMEKVVFPKKRESVMAEGNIPKSQLLALIKQYSKYGYKFHEALLYNIDLPAEYIQQYSNTSVDLSGNSFLNPIQIIVDEGGIFIPPSVPIFHDINMLFLVYMETENKFVLKREGEKKTKKVRFKLNNYTKKAGAGIMD
jgi:hypothetical protein